MLKIQLTTKGKGDTVIPPNQPTEGSGARPRFYPLLSVEYFGTCCVQMHETTLAACPVFGDHFTAPFIYYLESKCRLEILKG